MAINKNGRKMNCFREKNSKKNLLSRKRRGNGQMENKEEQIIGGTFSETNYTKYNQK